MQLALNMNNTALQTAVRNNSLRFTIKDDADFDVYCKNTTGTGTKVKTNEKVFDRQRKVNAQLAYDTKKVNQVSGFIMTGVESGNLTSSSSSVACPGGWDPDLASAQEDFPDAMSHIVEVGSSNGGLLVNDVLLHVTAAPLI